MLAKLCKDLKVYTLGYLTIPEKWQLIEKAVESAEMDFFWWLVEYDLDLKNNYGDTLLIWALDKKYISLAEGLIQKVNVNVRGRSNDTALMVAAEGPAKRRLEIVRMLLDHGADPNMVNDNGDTAMMFAIHSSCTDVALYLMTHCDIYIRDKKGETALSHALKFDKKGTISLALLEYKHNMNETGSSEMSLLGYAAQSSCYKVVKKLIHLGADPNIPCLHPRCKSSYTSALVLSVQRGEYDIFLAICNSGAELDATDHYGANSLIIAAEKGRMDMVTELINRGADLDTAPSHLSNPLLCAIEKGHTDIALYLIEKGAKPIGIHTAVKYNRTEILLALLANGADINTLGMRNQTPLFTAARFDCYDSFCALIDNGADLNYREPKFGSTVLMWEMYSCRSHTHKYILTLIDRGADLDVIDKKGCSTLSIALFKCACRKDGSFNHILKALVMKGINVNCTNEYGDSALIYALINGLVVIEDLLSNSRLDVNVVDKWSNATALIIAARKGLSKIVDLLIQRGANLDIQDSEGKTALMEAAMKGNSSICLALISSGSNISLTEKHDNKTALMLAEEKGHADVVEILRIAEQKLLGDKNKYSGMKQLVMSFHRMCSFKNIQWFIKEIGGVLLSLIAGQVLLLLVIIVSMVVCPP